MEVYRESRRGECKGTRLGLSVSAFGFRIDLRLWKFLGIHRIYDYQSER